MMASEEVDRAMDYLRQGWQYTPMSETQARQFKRFLAGANPQLCQQAIDDMIRRGLPRPGPAELAGIVASLGASQRRRVIQPPDIDEVPLDPELNRQWVELIRQENPQLWGKRAS